MQTEIAQAVALTIVGNDLLHGQPREDFWPTATVFKFCKNVTFVSLSGLRTAPIETPFAEDPLQWITKLKTEGTLGFRLHHIAMNDPRMSDRMSVGFVGGGGRRLIESVGNAVSDLWEAGWRVQNHSDPERKFWDVRYRRVGVDLPHRRPESRGLSTLQRELEDVLLKIEDFAHRQNQETFAKSFRRGIDLLHADTPLASVYHSDLAPSAGLPLLAKQILGAAQEAWVFGGMGSWNDLGFEGRDQEEYTTLSDQLFSLLNQAICEAVNSGFSDSG